MNKFLKSQNIIPKAILLAIVCMFIAFQTQAQNGYLEIVGPPALRFESKNTNEFLLAAKFPMLKPKTEPTIVSNATASNVDGDLVVSNAAVNNSEPETTTNIASGDISVLSNSIPAISPATNQNVDVSAPGGADNSVVTTAAAGDLLTTTPQMIMQYLKPDSNDGKLNPTNRPATAVFVPTWMGFMPALMQFPAESKTESRATYISK